MVAAVTGRSRGPGLAIPLLAVLVFGLGACTSAATSGSMRGLPAGYGRLSGSVGPGAPPNGTIPNMVLTFSNGTTSVGVAVKGGKYQIDLPAGRWDVRSPDGVCASGLSVAAGGWQRDDLVYPMGGCQDLGTPPSPPPPSGPVPGFYVDGPDSRPHYVLSVTSAPGGFAGWVFFVYQDGHISETLHYHSTSVTPDLLPAVRMVTDTTNETFPYQQVPPGSLAGSEPVPPGQTLSGTYGSTGFMLSNCGTYLYWANPANISEPMSCTFSFKGTKPW